ncbi:MAG: prolyl oligopeptidase family serine peptidase [Muribaculaceae bacterium]|nr:prolyl oligopeptidase family serine peptidase [Muribaculaceae bacterium]
MKHLLSIAVAAAAFILSSSASAQKKALDHSDFDNWKSVRNLAVSRTGEWTAFAVNPQEGDGVLTFYNTKTGKRINIERGYKPSIAPDGKWAYALIKPHFADTRKAKIDKKKDSEMPQDSLAIVDLSTLRVNKVGDVTDYIIAKDAGEWVAFKSVDTTLITPKQLKDKDTGRPLVIYNPRTGSRKVTKWVDNFIFSRDGAHLAITMKKPEKDSVHTNGVALFNLPDTSYSIIDRDKRFYGKPVFNESGSALAFTASDDSVKTGTKRTDVFLARTVAPYKNPQRIALEFDGGQQGVLMPNQYTELKFSHNDRRLIAGVAPVIAPNDTTIVDFEVGKLDIWVWDKAFNPPAEEHLLKEIRENNYPVSIDLDSMQPVLLTDKPLAKVVAPNRWDADNALILDPTDNIVSYQWDYFADTDMALVNLNTGLRKEIGKYQRSAEPEMSPSGKYVVWFRDRQYYVYDIAGGTTRCVSENVPEPLWDIDDDHPMPSEAYGVAAWSEDDKDLLVYDKYDIWSLDPQGKRKPVCLTAGYGRKNNYKIRYRNTDPERRYLTAGCNMLLNIFDYTDKYKGLATMTYGKAQNPEVSVLDGHSYTQVLQARDAQVYTWQRANFSESPDIWLSKGKNFAKAAQLTDANAQMKDYRWGTAQLVKWRAYNGVESEGVLYVPDNIDPEKKYPMLCVFYETGSEDLYTHYTMEPSWSWVNYPFYVSRGYVVFVPDIHYNSGRPGEDAYNFVCSGAEEMCRRYPWIDKEKIGIDGQSWGGYQTAFLVTRTNMFACAGSGAPVANMTSAYGGIRWESGDSRQPQYEQGQSRIGGSLWDKTQQYIANSPVFFANKVQTPLLIMHNDADGAVPWYQGIEMFMALRRLQKPVWMLQYNGEAHNIRARKNRKDITRRLQQFFDHYLKGDPMPKWMKEGVPMVRKGQEWGFELTEE